MKTEIVEKIVNDGPQFPYEELRNTMETIKRMAQPLFRRELFIEEIEEETSREYVTTTKIALKELVRRERYMLVFTSTEVNTIVEVNWGWHGDKDKSILQCNVYHNDESLLEIIRQEMGKLAERARAKKLLIERHIRS